MNQLANTASLFPPSSPELSKLLETEEDEDEGVQSEETWRAAKPPMAARCWSNVFPITFQILNRY